MKLKIFYTAKETTNKIRMRSIEWGELFANHVSNKELIFKIYKEPRQLNSKKKKPTNLKMGREIE